MKKTLILIFTLGIVFLLSSCTSGSSDEDLTSDTTENQIAADQYLYMNAFATFERKNIDGRITFLDTDYDSREVYSGKVRWKKTKNNAQIVQAEQVVEVNGTTTATISLTVEQAQSDTWSDYVSYQPKISAAGSAKDTAACYIRLVDQQGIEYRVSLTPKDGYNTSDFTNSAVYIIDPKRNLSFWYDQ